MEAAVTRRQLHPGDAEAFRQIRLEALATSPESFGSSVEEEGVRPLDAFTQRLTESHVVGAFAGEALVGVAGFYRLDRAKTAHRGTIWGVYVRPDFRGRGIARALIADILAHACTQVEQVHLCVVATNFAALRLYERLGFAIYGTEPTALRVGGRDYDEHLMVLRFARTA